MSTPEQKALNLRSLQNEAEGKVGAVKAATAALYDTLGSYGIQFLDERLSSDEVEEVVSRTTEGRPLYIYGCGEGFFSRFEKELEAFQRERLNKSTKAD
jgi:hypothetical protein